MRYLIIAFLGGTLLMTTKEFNKNNVIDILSDAYTVLCQLSTEYCDLEYNEGINDSSRIFRNVINVIAKMPVSNN